MSASLRQLDIFELRPLIRNISCKLSAISPYDVQKQLLCLVTEENDIVLRYISAAGQEVLKMITWFRRSNRVIHDVSFDPAGIWLLVLCFDNTLHIVPALAVLDKTHPMTTAYPLYSTTMITSYIIPFVGPHECPNSKNCPNHSANKASESKQIVPNVMGAECAGNAAEANAADVATAPAPAVDEVEIAAYSQDLPAHMLAKPDEVVPVQPAAAADATGNSQVMASSFMASKTCPYPLSVVWWKTFDGVNRAIIGYSDGSVCFVGLSPNCPFVASTEIDDGSVMKLLICKDNTLESVMLLITSSMKQQYKLLLEQKAIMYVYPGDISPTTSAKNREGEWQIVMPMPNTGTASLRQSNSSDPASDNSQLEEDVFVENDEVPTVTSSPTKVATNATYASTASSNSNSNSCSNSNVNELTFSHNFNDNQLPPPPPPSYAAAVARNQPTSMHENASQSSGMTFQQQQQQQQLPANSFDADAGILPAARARLASLKSLGSKKLQAIKMRLSDNRQRVDEYIPEHSLGSFAIMDSPSVTPERIGDTNGSFYNMQNLRSTYLLSALHPHSHSLTVHNIDINLKPLFFYKIPKHCLDLLISSNLLYAVQYVDLNDSTPDTSTSSGSTDEQAYTEKEKLDKDTEKTETQLPTGDDEACSRGNVSTQTDATGKSAHSTSTTSTTTTAEQSEATPNNAINAVSVISSAMASLRTNDDDKFNYFAQLGLFRFENETVLNLYQMATYRNGSSSSEQLTKEEKAKAFEFKDIHTPVDYVHFYETANVQSEYSLRQMEIMQQEFPRINYDPCYVVTNKNVYYVQLKREPFAIFLEAALASEWTQCRDFCNTFDLSVESCIEFAGDYLLRRRKVTQALLTYNVARVKPIRTALKLAMYGHNYALMQLSAMALKSTYVLRSRYLCHPLLQGILEEATYRHSEDIRDMLPLSGAERSKVPVNAGSFCSDYRYGVDESISALQMSPSSQFHLANLLLITLAEKAVNDKYYIPLWNFLVTNSKYHTNMTSIVLCQSGLFSAALVLAKMRGVCLDTFLALTSVMAQEFGWYTELNVCLYNLSEEMFTESITYLPQVSMDYFAFLQDKIDQIRACVLSRLAQQLNPFSATLRPIVSHTSTTWRRNSTTEEDEPQLNSTDDNNATFLFDFCKSLIETYLAVIIHMESQRVKRDCIINALSNFRINYEDNQFAIDSSRFKLISAGCAHCACIVDGVAYFWGSNGVPCCYSSNKSSDPPEPPHAVKALELLSQLHLEVHAVKCGRQHSLILTNNGLYAMGNNNLCQLGIGQHMQMALQPMLVRALDGKNISILEAGQYHNAAVADGQLYMWGWGVYGQLGSGSCENIVEPTPVSFFKFKKILQVSLGHAHSLVLCQAASATKNPLEANNNTTELFVFGSNHFGQLGIGDGGLSDDGSQAPPTGEDALYCSKEVKCILPVKLDVSTSRLRLIHTKFFTNLAVDENERMYTWGSSPQALRLANQIRRRANAKQKLEESQQREMSKRFEATITVPTTAPAAEKEAAPRTLFVEPSTSYAAVAGGALPKAIKTPTDAAQSDEDEANSGAAALQTRRVEACTVETFSSDAELSATATENLAVSQSATITEEVEDLTLVNDAGEIMLDAKTTRNDETKPKGNSSAAPAAQVNAAETDPCEHMTPHLVDTTEVAGQILQISSGLFHFALISSSCTLYTWGKNLEHQLGTEDKERRPVHKPSPIDSIDRPMYVDCGADFTLVMTVDYVVKAFGGNSNGQCGRALGASLDRTRQRVVCLPTTKRLMRFESQCVEAPVEINLPRPRIRLTLEPVRYLKCIPRYQPHFMQEANINFEQTYYEGASPQPAAQYKSSSENAITGQESDDLISSLENLSNNDASSLNYSYNAPPLQDLNSTFDDCTPEEQSYAPLAEHNAPKQMHHVAVHADAGNADSSTFTPSDEASADDENDAQQVAAVQPLRHYIHYCLYAFHGLYNPDKIRDFSRQRNEYRIRTLMLNFKFVDAFKLCLQDCGSAQRTLKIFEYFSKDTGYVPLRRQDLKYLIYHMCWHFLEQKFDMLECERFFLADLDYYLIELAFVLYFNNNNSLLEQNLNQKFKHLIEQDQEQHDLATDSNHQSHDVSVYKLDDTDAIFDAFSVRFKTIICQHLLKHGGSCSTGAGGSAVSIVGN